MINGKSHVIKELKKIYLKVMILKIEAFRSCLHIY